MGMNPVYHHVRCGWPGCEGVNFGSLPYFTVPGIKNRFVTQSDRVDFELRIRQHDRTKGHKERKLKWEKIITAISP